MKAWLHAQDRAESVAGEYRIVFSRNEAIEMTEHDAHELMRAAENSFPEYSWKMMKIPSSGLFIVEGTKKT